MKETIAVAILNFKQGTREKIFFGVIFFLVFLLALTFFLGVLAIGETEKVVRSAGIAGLEISGLLLILFSFTLSFYKEKETRILQVYLSYFSAPSYLIGKALGYFLITGFYLVIGSIGWAIILYFNNAFTWNIFPAVYLTFLKLIIVVSINLLLATLVASPTLALLGTLFIFYTSEVCAQALQLVVAKGFDLQVWIMKTIYFILPNMDKLHIKSDIAYGEIPELSFFVLSSAYSFAYVGFIFLVSVTIFSKREY